MGIFSNIMDKIFGHAKAETPAASPAGSSAPQPSAPAAPQPSAAAPAPARLSEVDVDAVLTKIAASKGGGGNWRTSIVDLLKLLDLDSSLAARKELATDLNVRAGADGSAEQNIALSKAVWKALAENGGKIPANLRD
jgi:3-oxoacyl-ACP reductase-like protein